MRSSYNKHTDIDKNGADRKIVRHYLLQSEHSGD